jgi:nucleotide-binding universal stress UspA family protein
VEALAVRRNMVLVPVDFEAASLAALELAKEVAGCFAAEVVLLHSYAVLVQTYPGTTPAETPSLPGIHVEVMAAAKRALDELAMAHGGLRSILAEGDPATAILDEVARLRPRMVVMGTHGRSGFKHLLLGSVAEKVIRHSPAPVTIVRSPGP